MQYTTIVDKSEKVSGDCPRDLLCAHELTFDMLDVNSCVSKSLSNVPDRLLRIYNFYYISVHHNREVVASDEGGVAYKKAEQVVLLSLFYMLLSMKRIKKRRKFGGKENNVYLCGRLSYLYCAEAHFGWAKVHWER